MLPQHPAKYKGIILWMWFYEMHGATRMIPCVIYKNKTVNIVQESNRGLFSPNKNPL